MKKNDVDFECKMKKFEESAKQICKEYGIMSEKIKEVPGYEGFPTDGGSVDNFNRNVPNYLNEGLTVKILELVKECMGFPE